MESNKLNRSQAYGSPPVVPIIPLVPIRSSRTPTTAAGPGAPPPSVYPQQPFQQALAFQRLAEGSMQSYPQNNFYFQAQQPLCMSFGFDNNNMHSSHAAVMTSLHMDQGANSPTHNYPAESSERPRITSTVDPITCYEDLVKLPEIPTKLNNLVLPEDKKRNSFRNSVTSTTSNTSILTAASSNFSEDNFDVVVDQEYTKSSSWFGTAVIAPLVSRFLAVSGLARKRIVAQVVDKVHENKGRFVRKKGDGLFEVDRSVAERFAMSCLERAVSEKIPVSAKSSSSISASIVPTGPQVGKTKRHTWHVTPSQPQHRRSSFLHRGSSSSNASSSVAAAAAAVAAADSSKINSPPSSQGSPMSPPRPQQRHSWHVKTLDKSPARAALKTKFKVPKARQASLETYKSDNPLAFLSQVASSASDWEEEN